MAYNVFSGIRTINFFSGIEITQLDDQILFNHILIKKQKSSLQKISVSTFRNVGDCLASQPKNTNTFIIFNTNDVLVKLVPKSNSDSLAIVNRAFPNFDSDEFYFEVAESGTKNLISICRKHILDQTIKKFRDINVGLSGFSIGMTSLVNLFPFFEEGSMITGKYRLIIANSYIETIETDYNFTNEEYNLNGLVIENHYLLSFAGVLQAIIKNTFVVSNFKNEISKVYEDYVQRRFFQNFLKMGLSLLLLVLVINFFYFNSYFSKVETLKQNTMVNTLRKINLMELDSITTIKKNKIEQIVNSSTSKSSYYFDNIASSTPETVMLSSIVYRPFLKPVKNNEQILYREKEILIEGKSSNSVSFSQWVEFLESYQWVSQVSIQEYNMENESQVKFTLRINYQDEN